VRFDDELPHNAVCHAGMRVALINNIMTSMVAHNARRMFWLCGPGRHWQIDRGAHRRAPVRR
jgi:hypothetical protein